MKQKVLSVILCMCMVMATCVTTLAADVDGVLAEAEALNLEADQEQEKIDELLEERNQLILQEDYEGVISIEQQMEAEGIRFLTAEEATAEYGDISSNEKSTLTPFAENVTWAEHATDYAYAGKTYTVDTLIAMPSAGRAEAQGGTSFSAG